LGVVEREEGVVVVVLAALVVVPGEGVARGVVERWEGGGGGSGGGVAGIEAVLVARAGEDDGMIDRIFTTVLQCRPHYYSTLNNNQPTNPRFQVSPAVQTRLLIES